MNTQPTIPLTSVESSMIDGHGYDAASQTLAVRFTGGGVYHYEGVPQETVAALLKAPSFGKAFGALVRNRYTGKRVSS